MTSVWRVSEVGRLQSEFSTFLFTIGGTAFGAALLHFSEIGRSNRARKEAKSALRASFSAEIYCNLALTIRRIAEIWDALDDGAEHVPALNIEPRLRVYNAAQDNLGLLTPETSAQIIYLYARLRDLIDQHTLVASYAGSTDGGYATHRLNLQERITELELDSLELIRILNGKGVGEYDVAFDLSPHQEATNITRARAYDERYRTTTALYERVWNRVRWWMGDGVRLLKRLIRGNHV